MLLDLLDAILQNKNSEIETHLHLIAEITGNFMLKEKLSENL